ncbi:GDP-mannose-dependent alpha-(1-6)-phosphatidylinositol monomannoside mannosyltransferase [Prochlorococcus marinus str. MIT 1313]|uniref:glycosyltransferase n=1 Tax=Prochlorococcus TaxID=1218 RepID=UPI0007B3C90A|nr:glycosyltransferase [Prochlorococcus marinus]KZR68541.1 GDP-mannose-dependent alpha-(1-6)-phosphatidylinositol monomannoside mannosyltransferase [Prochlorococcus marinus str. MIT 1313]KZR71222.1 GDP-mannose-dependent alpha-(1-6)-phosphatidylinositol monomannoside mannosyltransferase [Prochlorococcus marinus str. MIT 1318]
MTDSRQRLLVFAPTRRVASETFVRANLAGLPFEVSAYFGDEFPLDQPGRFAYGLGVLLSKICTRLGWLRLAELPAAFVAWVLIRRHRPDVVLAEFGFHAVRVMQAAARVDVPFVVHFRGSDLSANRRLGVLRSRYRRLVSIASGVVCKSRPMATTLEQLGASPSMILISPSGANPALFSVGDPALAAPVFLAVGRFVAKKGPLQTIRAFAGQPQGELWMVGEGPLLAEARRLVQALQVQDRVRFLGVKTQSEVAALMRQARVFVQHSQIAPDGDSEGNPVSVMEAQLCGLPVVATLHAGIPDVVLDGSTGLLVEESDVEGMAEAMTRLMADPNLAAQFGLAGRERVLAAFTLEHHLQDLTRFLQQQIRSTSQI